MPSPLSRIYTEGFGFGSGLLPVVYRVYAFALLVIGGLSDHVGRRPVVTTALVVEAASMVPLLLAEGVGRLLAVRIVQSATGTITGAIGAALLDVQDVDQDDVADGNAGTGFSR